ncbi:TPA: EpsG family protein [Photobacterium damselae]
MFFSFLNVYGYKSKILFFTLSLSVILLTGIRFGAGKDYFVYFALFSNLTDWYDANFELGFTIIVNLLRNLKLNVYDIFFFFAFFSIWPVIRAFGKYSKYPLFSLAIYFCLYLIPLNFNAVGQGVVTGLFFYSLSLMRAERHKTILILSVFSTLIHSSGIFIYIVYCTSLIKIQVNQLRFIFLISILVFFFSPYIYSLIMLLPIDILFVKMSSYAEQYNTGVKLTSIIQRVLIILPLLILYENFDDFNKKLAKVYIFGFLFYALFSFNGLLATRINLLFKVLDVLLIPNLLWSFKYKSERIITFIFFAIFSFVILSGNFKNLYIWDLKTIMNF